MSHPGVAFPWESLAAFVAAAAAAWAFAVVLEVIPDDLASSITKAITIPTIGIGAGKDCDGQVLVINDLVGFNANKAPSFAKQYDNFYDKMKIAVSLFKKDVDKKSL